MKAVSRLNASLAAAAAMTAKFPSSLHPLTNRSNSGIHASMDKSPVGNVSSNGGEHGFSSMLGSEIRANMSDIDVKMVNLREIFRHGDPLEVRRAASTKIVAIVRGFLARRRLISYRSGLRDWCWSRCRMVVWVLDILLANQSKLDAGIQRIKLSREIRWLYLVIQKWNIVVKQRAPLRRAVRKKAEDLFQMKQQIFLKEVWDAMKTVCVGSKSLKTVNQERRILIDEIRARLSKMYRDRGELGVVPDYEVQNVLRQHIIQTFLKKQQDLRKKAIFGGFKKFLDMCRRQWQYAGEHWFSKRAGSCFFAWSDHVYMVSLELERKRWPGPRKYEVGLTFYALFLIILFIFCFLIIFSIAFVCFSLGSLQSKTN